MVPLLILYGGQGVTFVTCDLTRIRIIAPDCSANYLPYVFVYKGIYVYTYPSMLPTPSSYLRISIIRII